MKIGIVGLGFVGSAIRNAMEPWCEICGVDSDTSKSTHMFQDLFSCAGIFICVPTPQDEDGKCHTDILETILYRLRDYKQGPIISKCTAPPDVYTRLSKQYPNLIHSPEFLTAANANRDYVTGAFAIIGGTITAYMNEAERIIRIGQQDLRIVKHVSIEEAAMAKYGINTFLATKVVYMNDLWQLCNKEGIDFDTVAKLMQLDSRIGKTHMVVPGSDGFGFAGACFPKDTAALSYYARTKETEMPLLDAAIKRNRELRNINTF